MKPILGVDLDNVIARTDRLICVLTLERFGVSLYQAAIREFAYSACGITREKEKEAFAFFHEGACLRAKTLEDTQESMQVLHERFEIHIVTEPAKKGVHSLLWDYPGISLRRCQMEIPSRCDGLLH